MELNCEVLGETFEVTTDHYPIIVEFPQINHQQKKRTIKYRDTKNMDVESLTADFKKMFEEINGTENSDFEMNYIQYDCKARKIVDERAPMITKTIREDQYPPWMDAEFKLNRAKRRKLEKGCKKNPGLKAEYIEQRKLCAKMAVVKQREYYTKLVSDAGKDQKTLFKIANELLDKRKVKILPEHDDPKQLANEFNRYYIEKIEKIRKDIPITSERIIEPTVYTGTKLSCFEPTDIEEVTELISEYGIKTSMEDPIPANILQLIIKDAAPTLVKLINQSLSSGSIEGVKFSAVDPLLKKCGLDSDVKKNYRPVNNLVFFSKLIGRVVSRRLNSHLSLNGLQNDKNFAYKKHHNTETMMVGLVDEVLEGFDNNQCTVIVFLDLSAAFDTIDHEKLLSIMFEELGITGAALQWFRSFLVGRTQQVRINGNYSESLEVLFGAPQGSVLGPELFSIYVRNQPKVFEKCHFNASAFADDSNGRKTFALTFQYEVLKNEVPRCLEEIGKWMNFQSLKINPDKTEILLLFPKSMENEVIIKGTIIGPQQCIRFSDVVKNVGVWIDKHLDMSDHVNKIVAHSYKILKDIGSVRSMLTQDHTETLVHAVISSRLDYCNTLFYNMSRENTNKLQKVQNAAARIVVRKRKRQSISGSIRELHWLRVESRIIFKILLLVYKGIRGTSSKNLQLDFKTHNCRPEDFLMLKTSFCKTKYGKRMFKYHAPRLWNALPLHIRTEEKIDSFKKMVKTLLFKDTDSFKAKAFRYS